MADSNYSQRWLEAFAEELGFPLPEVMQRAEDWLNSGEYWNEGSAFDGTSVPEEFWHHYKEVTGKDGEGNFFTCSC